MLKIKKQGGEICAITMLLEQSSHEYIKVIHTLVSEIVEAKKSTKDIEANIPSTLKNHAIKDEKGVFATKVNGKSTRLKVRALFIDTYNRNFELLKHKSGILRITKKSAKWIAQISVTIPTNEKTGTKILGVDLGLKVPAVAITDDDTVRFFGNGRRNKYRKRKFRSVRKKLGKAKKRNAHRQLDDKEQRWMQDRDHKVSRVIVAFATANNISVIRLEQLTSIRQTARTSRKNEKNLHTWSIPSFSTIH